jgi:hypothetical protein
MANIVPGACDIFRYGEHNGSQGENSVRSEEAYAVSAAGREYLTAMLDVLVYENILVAWRRMPLGGYLIVSHEGEEIGLTAQQAETWTQGAFAVYLALVDQRRISPRIPGDTSRN